RVALAGGVGVADRDDQQVLDHDLQAAGGFRAVPEGERESHHVPALDGQLRRGRGAGGIQPAARARLAVERVDVPDAFDVPAIGCDLTAPGQRALAGVKANLPAAGVEVFGR